MQPSCRHCPNLRNSADHGSIMLGMKLNLAILAHPVLRVSVSTLVGLLPIWLRPKDNHPFLRALIPVLITYFLAAAGTAYVDPLTVDESALGIRTQSGRLDPAQSVLPVLLFTIGFAVMPALLCGDFEGRQRIKLSPAKSIVMGFWYGWPIMILATQSGGLSLLVAATHWAASRREDRTWVFVEYGATSASLVFLFVAFGNSLYPWGLLAALLQVPLLTGLAVWVRKLYVSEGTSAPSHADAEIADNVSSSQSLTKIAGLKRRGGHRTKRKKSRLRS